MRNGPNLFRERSALATRLSKLISGAMEYTAHALKEQLAKGREERAARPLENGLLQSGAAVTALDVNALTKNDIINILKQVEKGAKVQF